MVILAPLPDPGPSPLPPFEIDKSAPAVAPPPLMPVLFSDPPPPPPPKPPPPDTLFGQAGSPVRFLIPPPVVNLDALMPEGDAGGLIVGLAVLIAAAFLFRRAKAS